MLSGIEVLARSVALVIICTNYVDDCFLLARVSLIDCAPQLVVNDGLHRMAPNGPEICATKTLAASQHVRCFSRPQLTARTDSCSPTIFVQHAHACAGDRYRLL
jgi:hypothetical protein